MNVLIISTNRYKKPMPVVPFGACIAADAAHDAGHNTRFFDMMFSSHVASDLVRCLRSLQPDVVGISIRNIDNNDMETPISFTAPLKNLTKLIRKHSDARLVVGGAAMGVMPAALLKETEADWGVVSDGEIAFPRLLNSLVTGDDPRLVPGIAWMEDGHLHKGPAVKASSAECPIPHFERWINLAAYRQDLCAIPIQTKRGCPHDCSYCTYPQSEGRDYRLTPPSMVVDSIRRLEAYGMHDLEFVDNVFNSPYSHAVEICDLLAITHHKVRLSTMEINPKFLDATLLRSMKKAHFTGFGMAAESAADPVLEGLKKGYAADDVAQAAKLIARQDIPCMWMFLLGGPGETEATVKQTLDFASKYIPPRDTAFFNIGIRLYPGTALEKTARQQGLIDMPQDAMLEPVFYFSPEVDPEWARLQVQKAVASNRHFLGPTTINYPFLPFLHRVAGRVGMHPPLWRHTRKIRQVLWFLGR